MEAFGEHLLLNFSVMVYATLSLLVSFLAYLRASPVLSIFARWMRWILFSLILGWGALFFGFTDRPFEIVVAIGFISFFLIESIFSWILINNISRSQLPLFPSFEENKSGDEWPTDKRFIRLREAIRREGFRKELSAKATLIGQFQVRSALYADDDRHIRLQVILLPSSSGMVVPCYLLTSLLKDGTQVITDNLFLPFGGFYPENWHVERRPWKRSFSRLMRRHRDRILPHRDELATWETDVLDDLQEQPRMLDRLNVEMGFFFPVHERDEEGRITREGRYRVWKELWLLKYFGIPLKT